ncbi:Telomerase reverse transcriptase [Lecanosticta acicola]|uniref:Telomerase reverse transcriptase n=1 Tax=Lecanosticta acicola TaxID=111012 RepID=A0AAI9E7Q1_9PEZI|nr:Telomerase reverse transcriptase [Lecanosticta acicola]
MKRKRPTQNRDATHAAKRLKPGDETTDRPSYPLLGKYYTDVVTLRQYLASRLTKKRRRRLQQYGRDGDQHAEAAVSRLLDKTVVGAFQPVNTEESSFVEDDLSTFTQQLSHSESSILLTPGELKQTEIVDFTVWLLFRRHTGQYRPKHLLCKNFQKYVTEYNYGPEPEIVSCIPGIYSSGPNEHVQTLKQHPWNAIPTLLGKGAERVMVDLLLDCGVFMPVIESSNLIQLSGVPMSDLELQPTYSSTNQTKTSTLKADVTQRKASRGLSDIRFVRSRMLYARAASTSKGHVRFGLNPIHVLSRCRDTGDVSQTQHVMKHVFPSQFGLHNVLASNTDGRETGEPFKDYTLREREITSHRSRQLQRRYLAGSKTTLRPGSVPKRLRGEAQHMIHQLRKRHSKCSYFALLNHYCPVRTENAEPSQSSIRQAADVAQVSAFCRAAVLQVFPKALWGSGEMAQNNVKKLKYDIDRFVRLRRYESLSLHDVLQGLRLDEIDWLIPPNARKGDRLSMSDFAKRKELMTELLYYLFDSFLIPLLRAHFHITESNMQRNQLFYFRHDVWRRMSEPMLASLKLNMFEECNATDFNRMVAKRSLGISNIRLLPKERGMRPIINLRRRVQILQNGRLTLGKSINSLMTPAFSVLNYEKTANPAILGSALFSVDDLFPRLQLYRQSLVQQGLQGRPLYFAKVDVQSCFDTIPQKQLMRLVRRVISSSQYQTTRYSRAKLAGGDNKHMPGFGAKPSWKFLTKATASTQALDFRQEVEDDTADGRTRSVYINGNAQKRESRHALLALLEEHVEANLIKIGKRYYRQKEGIPQGSIVSSLLCSYFYAELEREELEFVNDGRSVLLRLIDDFLVISTERDVVARFLNTMHAGIPRFGVTVKAEKSRANFDVEVDEGIIARNAREDAFPYCGNAIDTRTLNITKDLERRRKSNIADSVTVEYTKLPGQTLYRKTLNALKLQMHAMHLSTAYNDVETVLSNVYHCFSELAQKCYHYVKSLPVSKQPGSSLVVRTVDDSIKLACVLMKRRKKTKKDILDYECCVKWNQTRWLACVAFLSFFRKRQSKFRGLIAFLEKEVQGLRIGNVDVRLLEQVVAGYNAA